MNIEQRASSSNQIFENALRTFKEAVRDFAGFAAYGSIFALPFLILLGLNDGLKTLGEWSIKFDLTAYNDFLIYPLLIGFTFKLLPLRFANRFGGILIQHVIKFMSGPLGCAVGVMALPIVMAAWTDPAAVWALPALGVSTVMIFATLFIISFVRNFTLYPAFLAEVGPGRPRN